MRCHHFCNEPFRCWTCYVGFLAWAQARTNSPPRRRHRGVGFYECVNVIRPAVQVAPE
jgi:hypothetical protein